MGPGHIGVYVCGCYVDVVCGCMVVIIGAVYVCGCFMVSVIDIWCDFCFVPILDLFARVGALHYDLQK